MKFVVLGGDDRMVRLCRLLAADGHSVSVFALEKALPGWSGPDWDGADCVVLPLPCERDGALNAPFSGERHRVERLLARAAPGTPVCAGKAGKKVSDACAALGLPMYDYFLREDFAVKNAALTAEGAAALMMEHSPRALAGRGALICGFGRIGRLLALRLKALEVQVSVAARSAADLAWAEAMGCRAVELENVHNSGPYDFVLNTIPEPVLGKKQLESFGGALLLELASPPYGFDPAAAEEMGKSIVPAPGLPGRMCPESAAEAVRDTLYRILAENGRFHPAADGA